MLLKTYLVNKIGNKSPIHVRLSNAKSISSTHSGQQFLTMLPEAARQAHILPGLASHYLVSIWQLCDDKYRA